MHRAEHDVDSDARVDAAAPAIIVCVRHFKLDSLIFEYILMHLE
jgi:hypothetical protein